MAIDRRWMLGAVLGAAAWSSTAYADGWTVSSSNTSPFRAASIGSLIAAHGATWSVASGDSGSGGGTTKSGRLAWTDDDGDASAMLVEATAPDVQDADRADADPMVEALPALANDVGAVPMIAIGVDADPL